MNKKRTSRQRLGQLGEDHVAAFLEERGFSIVGRNVQVGRLEIDLIAVRNRLIVFCEVRTRSSTAFGDPAQTVDPRKVRFIRQAAGQWLKNTPRYRGYKIRFDVAGVLVERSSRELDYYTDAF